MKKVLLITTCGGQLDIAQTVVVPFDAPHAAAAADALAFTATHSDLQPGDTTDVQLIDLPCDLCGHWVDNAGCALQNCPAPHCGRALVTR